jgi:hypothetical protein
MLVGVSRTVAWRIGVGSCDRGGASVAVTTDGGGTWTDGTTPFSTIVRGKATSGRSAFVIGAGSGSGSGCAPAYASTGNGGGTWSAAGLLDRAWYRDPARPAVVHAPGPATSSPCGRGDVLDLAVISYSRADVLCAGGAVRTTSTTGASWSQVGRVRGAVALAVPVASPSLSYVAVLGEAGCSGVSIQRLGQRKPLSCVTVASTGPPGAVALAVVDGGGWLAVDTRTWRSTDALATWSAA